MGNYYGQEILLPILELQLFAYVFLTVTDICLLIVCDELGAVVSPRQISRGGQQIRVNKSKQISLSLRDRLPVFQKNNLSNACYRNSQISCEVLLTPIARLELKWQDNRLLSSEKASF